MIVAKAVNMAKAMNIPILGVVENYSFAKCPDCGKEIKLFGESHIEQTAAEHGIEVLAKLPIDPDLAKASDQGVIELYQGDYAEHLCDVIEEKTKQLKRAWRI